MPKSKSLQVVLYNWPVKILSFITALLLFLIIQMVSVSERTFSVPLQVDFPTDLQVESSVPQGVRLTVTGPEELIYRILPEQLAVTADFSDVTEPGTYERTIVIVSDGLEMRTDMLNFSSEPETVKIYFGAADEILEEQSEAGHEPSQESAAEAEHSGDAVDAGDAGGNPQ